MLNIPPCYSEKSIGKLIWDPYVINVEFPKLIPRILKECDFPQSCFIDVFTVMHGYKLNKPELFDDAVHLSEKGLNLIAETVSKCLSADYAKKTNKKAVKKPDQNTQLQTSDELNNNCKNLIRLPVVDVKEDSQDIDN